MKSVSADNILNEENENLNDKKYKRTIGRIVPHRQVWHGVVYVLL